MAGVAGVVPPALIPHLVLLNHLLEYVPVSQQSLGLHTIYRL